MASKQSEWSRRAARLRIPTVVAWVILAASGCDALDPRQLMHPQSADRTEAPVGESGPLPSSMPEAPLASLGSPAEVIPASPPAAPPEAEKRRAPDMQSIGPGESERVYYQFVDDRGRVQFVERLADVPPAWRDRVGYVEMSQPPPLTPLEARRSWTLSAERTAELLVAEARPSRRGGGRGSFDVILYSAEWCGYCRKARAHLDREGVDYEERDVDIQAVASELREKTGRGGIPVLDSSGRILRGYRADAYDRAIREIRG